MVRALTIALLALISIYSTALFPPPAASAAEQSVKERWKGIYVGGEKIGHSYMMTTARGNSSEIYEETELKMLVLGTTQDVDIKGKYVLNGYALKRFTFSMRTGNTTLSASGKRVGNAMEMDLNTAHGASHLSYGITDDTIVIAVLDRWLAGNHAKVGDQFKVSIFDPLSAITGVAPEKMVADVRITAREKVTVPLGAFDALRVNMVLNGSDSTFWMNGSGESVKEISEPDFVAVLESKDKALGAITSAVDIVEKTALRSNVVIENPTRLKFLRVKIGGISSEDGLDLDDRKRQMFRDGTLEVRPASLGDVRSYAIPYRGGAGGLDAYLRPTFLIQSTDPALVATASRVIDGETDALAATKRLVDWTYRSLKKTPSIGIPNALDVLKTRRGDCNEHATLFAALARASGIPTKLALGVVYLNGKFYYHAWNEVYVGEWVAVDATFGQFPADASHIKFIEGDLDRGGEILKLVGKLKLEILEAS